MTGIIQKDNKRCHLHFTGMYLNISWPVRFLLVPAFYLARLRYLCMLHAPTKLPSVTLRTNQLLDHTRKHGDLGSDLVSVGLGSQVKQIAYLFLIFKYPPRTVWHALYSYGHSVIAFIQSSHLRDNENFYEIIQSIANFFSGYCKDSTIIDEPL